MNQLVILSILFFILVPWINGEEAKDSKMDPKKMKETYEKFCKTKDKDSAEVMMKAYKCFTEGVSDSINLTH